MRLRANDLLLVLEREQKREQKRPPLNIPASGAFKPWGSSGSARESERFHGIHDAADASARVFELLQSEKGIVALQQWVQGLVGRGSGAAGASGGSSGSGSRSFGDPRNIGGGRPPAAGKEMHPDVLFFNAQLNAADESSMLVGEYHFLGILHRLCDCSEAQAWALFNLLDTQLQGALGFADVYLAIRILAAKACRAGQQLMHHHASTFLKKVSGSEHECELEEMTFEWPRLLALLLVFDISSKMLAEIVETNQLHATSTLSYATARNIIADVLRSYDMK